MKKIFSMMVLVAVVALSACAPHYESNVVSADSAGRIKRTEAGTVISVRPVTIKGDPKDNMVGTLGGAALGGIGGSGIGGGKGQAVGAIGGALLGGLAGNKIQDQIETSEGFEYVIKLEGSGSMVTVVQGQDIKYAVGQKVFLIKDPEGRSRIVAQP